MLTSTQAFSLRAKIFAATFARSQRTAAAFTGENVTEAATKCFRAETTLSQYLHEITEPEAEKRLTLQES